MWIQFRSADGLGSADHLGFVVDLTQFPLPLVEPSLQQRRLGLDGLYQLPHTNRIRR